MAKKALLIGINYPDTDNELFGCVNDIKYTKKLLEDNGFLKSDIVILSDGISGAIRPTKTNVLKALNNLVDNAQPGDTLVWHYSGHGTRTIDRNGDEQDGKDEGICPTTNDGKDIDVLIDDDIKAIFDRLPPDVQLFALMDCCNSGTILDLANNVVTKGFSRTAYKVMVSGCLDRQTSADASFKGRAQGALTACFKEMVGRNGFNNILKILFSNSKKQLLAFQKEMRAWLKSHHFTQIPNIAFEGDLPMLARTMLPGIGTMISSAVAPILNVRQIGGYALRDLIKRQSSGTGVSTPGNYAEVEVEAPSREVRRLR